MSNFDITEEDGSSHELYTFCWLYRQGDAWLATAGADSLIHILSLANSQEVKVLEGHKSECEIKRRMKITDNVIETILDLQSHPQNDNIILSTSKDGTLRLWDIDASACLAIFECDATASVEYLTEKVEITLLIYVSLVLPPFRHKVYYW